MVRWGRSIGMRAAPTGRAAPAGAPYGQDVAYCRRDITLAKVDEAGRERHKGVLNCVDLRAHLVDGAIQVVERPGQIAEEGTVDDDRHAAVLRFRGEASPFSSAALTTRSRAPEKSSLVTAWRVTASLNR